MFHEQKFKYAELFEARKRSNIHKVSCSLYSKHQVENPEGLKLIEVDIRIFLTLSYDISDNNIPVMFVCGEDVSTELLGQTYFCGYLVGCKKFADILSTTAATMTTEDFPPLDKFPWVKLDDGQYSFTREKESHFVDIFQVHSYRGLTRRTMKNGDVNFIL